MQDVHVSVKDGGLGASGTAADGVHVKIGVSSAPALEVLSLSSASDTDEITAALGYSPLADAVMDAFQAGASTIYCIPIAGAVAGSIGAVTKTGTGEATNAATGDPGSAYEVVLEVLTGGALNEASYRVSIDGGDNFTEEATLPAGGAVVIENTGVTITFTESATPENSFVAGDVYSFKTEAPSASNEEVLNALAVAKELLYEYEFIHVVGESTKTLWAAVAAEMNTFLSDKFLPIFAICEARNIDEGESLDEYVQALLADRAAVENYRLQVVAGRGELSARDGKIRDSNLAGLVSGLYGVTPVGSSIGEVQAVSLDAVTALKPEGIEKHINTLDQAGFLTARRYLGLSGFYVTNARMCAPSTSDYKYAERLRPMNKLVRLTRQQGLSQMQIQVDPTNYEGSLKMIEAFLAVPGEKMVSDKELAAVNISIPTDQDILSSESLNVEIGGTPMGILKNMVQNFSMVNPFRKG